MIVEFTVVIMGDGETLDDAWENAVENFAGDPGSMPEDHQVEDES